MPKVETKDLLVGGVALGLVGLGVVMALRKPPMTKKSGDSLLAKIGFEHLGDRQDIWVGVGFAPAQTIGHGAIQGFKYEPMTVETDEEYGPYSVEVKALIPSLPAGKADIFVFIQKAGGGLNPDGTGFLAGGAEWFEDILTIV